MNDGADNGEVNGPSTSERLGALRRTKWRESEEYKESRRLGRYSLTVGLLLAVGFLAIWLAARPFNEQFALLPNTRLAIGIYGALLILYIASFLPIFRMRSARRAFEDRFTLGLVRDLQAEETQLVNRDRDEGKKTDLGSLWAITQKRIDLYHSIATGQARDSFRVGQIAAIAGFVAVLTLGVLAAFTNSSTGAIAASIIAVAGAGMSGYIGATFMKAQAEASKQLRQFFLQPVEFSRMLGVERLLVELPEDQRSEAVQQIIRSMMRSPDAINE